METHLDRVHALYAYRCFDNGSTHDMFLASKPSARNVSVRCHGQLVRLRSRCMMKEHLSSSRDNSTSPSFLLPIWSAQGFVKQARCAHDPRDSDEPLPLNKVLQQGLISVCRWLAASVAAASLMAGVSMAHASPPSSQIAEIGPMRTTAISAWAVVRDTFEDSTFNNQDWEARLQQTLADFPSDMDSKEKAYAKIEGMLASLGDPYTRILNPQEFKSFQISKDGAVEGVGLLLGSDQGTGRLVVLSPIEGGPAARAGIISGDELVQIDGQSIQGMDGEEAAARLRGRVGTLVTLGIHRKAEVGGNVAASPADMIKIKLLREKIRLSPISTTILPSDINGGHHENTLKIGYIHLSTFSQAASHEVEMAIRDMERKHVNSYILDLRDNPGGLVRAAFEIAEMWLNGSETVVNTVDRGGNMEMLNLPADSHPLTKDPLVVLLNNNSASASEILAGALHDNGRAILMGHRSFGKGKIQSVTELEDGSGLFVTIAKYVSPALHQIDKTGIPPDMECATTPMDNGPLKKDVKSLLLEDPCLLDAQHQLSVMISKGKF